MNEALSLEETAPTELSVVIEVSGDFNTKFVFSGFLCPHIPKKIEFSYDANSNFQEKNYWKSSNYLHHLPSVLRDALVSEGCDINRSIIEKKYAFGNPQFSDARKTRAMTFALALIAV